MWDETKIYANALDMEYEYAVLELYLNYVSGYSIIYFQIKCGNLKPKSSHKAPFYLYLFILSLTISPASNIANTNIVALTCSPEQCAHR